VPFRSTWRFFLLFISILAAEIGILSLFGEDRIKQWRPHPGGYPAAILIVMYAFCHFRQIRRCDPASIHPPSDPGASESSD
jgi:hypothetical protein